MKNIQEIDKVISILGDIKERNEEAKKSISTALFCLRGAKSALNKQKGKKRMATKMATNQPAKNGSKTATKKTPTPSLFA